MIYDTEFVSAKYKNTKNEIKITQKPPDTGNRKHLINLICADSLHLINSRLKSVHIWSFSEPYFHAFRLNTEIYRVSLRIRSEFGNTFHVTTGGFSSTEDWARVLNFSLLIWAHLLCRWCYIFLLLVYLYLKIV